jgi:hypothetical protein
MPEPHDRAEKASNASLWWHNEQPHHGEDCGAQGKSEADCRAMPPEKRLA